MAQNTGSNRKPKVGWSHREHGTKTFYYFVGNPLFIDLLNSVFFALPQTMCYWGNLLVKVFERMCTGLGMGLGMAIAFAVIPSKENRRSQPRR